MLKKRFYDILTIVYIILVIVVFLTGNVIFLNTSLDKTLEGDYTFFAPIYIARIILSVFGLAYWVFILLLAIKLHKKELTKTIDLVVIILIAPLAPIFYLFNLRKSLKKYEAASLTGS